MRQRKRRIFAGQVCEQIVDPIPERVKDINRYKAKSRFESHQEYHDFKLGISRRLHARKFNANFSPTSLYSTLTCRQENELHDFVEAKRVGRNFIRALKRKYPAAVIFLYVGAGKTTHRIHFHMVSEGVPEEFIAQKWKHGSIKRISCLRERNYYDGIDRGQDYTGLANYLFDHWTPEVGGHRWMETKNAKQPEIEEATEVHIRGGYNKKRTPPAPKGYVLVETKATKYGHYYYKYVKLNTKRKTGHKSRIP